MHTPGIYKGEEIEPQDPALALVEKWLLQAPTEEKDLQDAEEDLREIQLALNATREQAGARALFT